eukprot:200643_1
MSEKGRFIIKVKRVWELSSGIPCMVEFMDGIKHSWVNIVNTTTENENGIVIDAVYVICRRSNKQSPEIYGTSVKSIRRAAVRLNEICKCGSHFHRHDALQYNQSDVSLL